VLSHAMPDVGKTFPPVRPQSSDDFAGKQLGLQWEWNHNPVNTYWSLNDRSGYLRLRALPAPNLVSARNTLTQVQQGRISQVTVRLDVSGMADGQRAGLAMFGKQPSWIGVTQAEGKRTVTFAWAGQERQGSAVSAGSILLRMEVADETVRYFFSLDDGRTFGSLGLMPRFQFSWWKGARPALFTFNTAMRTEGVADFDWIRIRMPDDAK